MSEVKGEWEEVSCDGCGEKEIRLELRRYKDSTVIDLKITCKNCLRETEVTLG